MAILTNQSNRYPRIQEILEQSKLLVQESKEHIAESKRLQESYNELQRTSDELLKEGGNAEGRFNLISHAVYMPLAVN